jgi:hypothetical protein
MTDSTDNARRGGGMKLYTVPIDLETANEFVTRHHRHHCAVVGHKFSIGATTGDGLEGVVIVGRPVSRHRDNGLTLEVTRLCTLGRPNVCSFLYGAAARAAFALGYKRIGTYIRKDETGISLKAAGWRLIGETPGRSWSVPSRLRKDKTDLIPRFLFEATQRRGGDE